MPTPVHDLELTRAWLCLSRDKIITGSFDKTCKLWSAETGQLYHTYRGHSTEIVCLSFNPQGTVIATGSMDNTAKLWDVETGQELHTLFGHTAEIVSLNFDTQGERIITGSFDHTVKVWDVRSGRCIHTLAGHHGEISSTQFNYTGELCISGSIDRTCKIWDVASGQNVQTLRGHNDEILDVSFNATGSKLVTASADGTSRIYNTMTGACQAILIGHEAEISKVCFNPQGSKVLTASSDKVARLWEVETGDCLQMLEGHTDEIFSCAFNYEGDTVITGRWLTAGLHRQLETHAAHSLSCRLERQHVPDLEVLRTALGSSGLRIGCGLFLPPLVSIPFMLQYRKTQYRKYQKHDMRFHLLLVSTVTPETPPLRGSRSHACLLLYALEELLTAAGPARRATRAGRRSATACKSYGETSVRSGSEGDDRDARGNAREVRLLLHGDVDDERYEAHVHDGLDELERLGRHGAPQLAHGGRS